jgi:hypothetical protein
LLCEPNPTESNSLSIYCCELAFNDKNYWQPFGSQNGACISHMLWPLNNLISQLDRHMNDKAGQQLRCENDNDHKEHHGRGSPIMNGR